MASLANRNLYDHSIRVPLIMQGPGVPKGVTVNELTYSYDLYPTLCELASIPIPSHIEGQSLVPLSQGAAGHPHVCTVYKEIMQTIRAGDWKLIRYRHSATRGVGQDRVQLFNIADDPAELIDHAREANQHARIQALNQQLDTWLATVMT